MKGLLSATLFAVLTSSFFVTQAAQAAFEQHEYDCEIGDLEDSYNCADSAVATEKKRLNKVYRDIYLKLSTSQKRALDSEQKAWIKKRDAKCNSADYSNLPGNMGVWQEISDNLCVARETQTRTKSIMNNYKVK